MFVRGRIEVLKPKRPKDEDFVARLTEIAPDCCPVVAYGALLPQRVLDIPTHGWVNLHFSLLPAWRGAAPVQHAILAGDAGHRRDHLPDRAASSTPARPTPRVTEPIRPDRHLRRPAATGSRSAVPRCWSRPSTAIEDGSLEPQPQPEAEVTLRVQDQRRGRHDRLEPSRPTSSTG